MTKDAVTSFTDPLKHIRGLESVSEKLLHNTTIAILLFMFLLLASKPLFGSPITCQVPPDWPSGASTEYFKDVCYYGQRVRISFKETLNRGNGRGTMSMNTLTGTSEYYMWLPLFPIFLGGLCLLPVLFWKFVGLDCFHGLDIVSFLEFYNPKEDREELTDVEKWRRQKLALQLHRWITTKRDSIFGLSSTLLLYVFMKWFRVAIFLFQFWMIAKAFGDGNLLWGYDSIVEIAQGRTINKLQGEFTLISGCKVQRFQMGFDRKHHSSSMYTATAMCVLSANFINATAFLFLYWWFLFVSFVSFCSAVNSTIIMVVPLYRKYEISSMIRSEEYFIVKCGEPHPDLNIGTANSIDYFIEYLGNDGYLVVQMVHDMLHHYSCDRLTEEVWIHVIVNNGKEELLTLDEKQDKSENRNTEDRIDTEIDGGGDRHRAGSEHPNKRNSISSSIESKKSVSCAEVSLSKESQPSLLLSESDEESLLKPLLLNSLSF
uniref:Innexin n=2 Tax=Caenorhabditis tropicalis TaxID=1561998 RepID=A0A1I7TKG2_9PELO